MGAQSGYSGAKRWEDKYPEAAAILRVLTDAESQQEPTFQSSLAYTGLTTKSALSALKEAGVEEEILLSENGMGLILNRMGYRLGQSRRVCAGRKNAGSKSGSRP